MRRSLVLGVLIPAAVAAGCSSSRDEAVRQVAGDFRAAIRSEDGAGACHRLSDAVRFEVELSSGATCDVEIATSGLPTAGPARRVDVSGTAAQVRYDDDVIFLSEFGDGWKVIAAGCLRRAVGPYDCQVGG